MPYTVNPDGTIVGQESSIYPDIQPGYEPVGDVYRDTGGVYRGTGTPQPQAGGSYGPSGGGSLWGRYSNQVAPPSPGETWMETGRSVQPGVSTMFPQAPGDARTAQYPQRMGGGGGGGSLNVGREGLSPIALERTPYRPPTQPGAFTPNVGGIPGAPRAGAAPGAPGARDLPTDLWNRLTGLLKDPSSITQDPSYKFRFGQGMEALNRTAAAGRMRFAGRTMLGAEQFGQGLASDEYARRIAQLTSGAGNELTRWQAGGAEGQQQYQNEMARWQAETGAGQQQYQNDMQRWLTEQESQRQASEDAYRRWGTSTDLYNQDYQRRLEAAQEEQRIRDLRQIPGMRVYGDLAQRIGAEEAKPYGPGDREAEYNRMWRGATNAPPFRP